MKMDSSLAASRQARSGEHWFVRFELREKADKRRKLYNGMIKCELHMYFKDPSASNRGENKHSDRPSAKRPAKR